MKNKAITVIPARYGSVRFPGKVLADLKGKPIIQWVYEKAEASISDEVIVATDDLKVVAAVERFGGKAVMTSLDHPSGTDRIWEAAKDLDAEIIINVQGDEPLMPPEVINQLIEIMRDKPEIEMATVAVPRHREEIADNQNIVKVVFNNEGYALYFSRSEIPFLRQAGQDLNLYHHWGIYGYRKSTLERFISLPEGKYEKCEKLEQLRALENGIGIYVLESNEKVVGIDTPEDLKYAEKLI